MNCKRAFYPWIAVLSLLMFLALLPVNLFAQDKQIPQRSDIDDKYKWNLEVMYPNLDAWEADFAFVDENYKELASYKGRLGESADLLYEYFKLEEKINILADNLSTYAGLKLSEDNRLSAQQELSGRIRSLRLKIRHASSFKRPELLNMDIEKLRMFLQTKPELKIYNFYIEDLIRRRKHILSSEEEAILALSGSIARSPGQIFSMLTEADISFGSIYDEDSILVQLTDQRYTKFRTSKNRRVRRDAHNSYYGTYEKYANTIAASLGGALKKDFFYMNARGYKSCLEMGLNDNNIPVSVYYNLIETVNANLEPLHKWAALKKKILGYDTLYAYDLYVPLAPTNNQEYSYEQAMEMVLEGMKPMGEQYLADYKMGLNSGWVDVFETEGKSSGAFSGGSFTSSPYILLNYNGTIEWIFTLAHEMGHSMQSYYVNQTEPYVSADYSTFVAEVASTGCESILMKHLLKNAKTKQEKIFLLNLYIKDIRTTFFRQIMFGEFELAIHTHMENGGAFSADYFRKTFSEIYQKYWGETLAVDDLSGMLGLVIPHFYWQYYVYQYATSFAAAQLISQKIIDGDKAALDSYMKFLATGSSKYPVDVLKEVGVDMTLQKPILHTIELFGNLVDELEALLDKN